MTHFSVDSEQVLAANITIQATISRLQLEVDNLHNNLQGLQSSWQGVAANSFQDLVGRWRITATTVQQQLGEVSTALAFAAKQYSEIEQANVRLFI
jgi:early secretory antigenic target protein ESAT-6